MPSRRVAKPVFKRILLKPSGEVLGGKAGVGIDQHEVRAVAEKVRDVARLGVEVALVIGGGNILRGAAAESLGMERVAADYAGMLATVINALALQDALCPYPRVDRH